MEQNSRQSLVNVHVPIIRETRLAKNPGQSLATVAIDGTTSGLFPSLKEYHLRTKAVPVTATTSRNIDMLSFTEVPILSLSRIVSRRPAALLLHSPTSRPGAAPANAALPGLLQFFSCITCIGHSLPSFAMFCSQCSNRFCDNTHLYRVAIRGGPIWLSVIRQTQWGSSCQSTFCSRTQKGGPTFETGRAAFWTTKPKDFQNFWDARHARKVPFAHYATTSHPIRSVKKRNGALRPAQAVDKLFLLCKLWPLRNTHFCDLHRPESKFSHRPTFPREHRRLPATISLRDKCAQM